MKIYERALRYGTDRVNRDQTVQLLGEYSIPLTSRFFQLFFSFQFLNISQNSLFLAFHIQHPGSWHKRLVPGVWQMESNYFQIWKLQRDRPSAVLDSMFWFWHTPSIFYLNITIRHKNMTFLAKMIDFESQHKNIPSYHHLNFVLSSKF